MRGGDYHEESDEGCVCIHPQSYHCDSSLVCNFRPVKRGLTRAAFIINVVISRRNNSNGLHLHALHSVCVSMLCSRAKIRSTCSLTKHCALTCFSSDNPECCSECPHPPTHTHFISASKIGWSNWNAAVQLKKIGEREATTEFMLSLTGIKSPFSLSPFPSTSLLLSPSTAGPNMWRKTSHRWDESSRPVPPPSWWSGPLDKQIHQRYAFADSPRGIL